MTRVLFLKNYSDRTLMEGHDNHVILVEPVCPTFARLAQELEKAKDTTIYRASNPQEVMDAFKKSGPCLVLLTANEKEQIVNGVAFLRSLNRPIQIGQMRFFVALKVTDPRIVGTFLRQGADAIFPNVSDQTLYFKTRFQLKGLLSKRRALEKKNNWERTGVTALQRTKPRVLRKTWTKNCVPGSYLEGGKDIWLLRSTRPNKQAEKWIVRCFGPQPTDGTWNKLGTDGTKWAWVPTGSSLNAAEFSGWIFEGEKPEFEKVENSWHFSAVQPVLYFAVRGKALNTKFQYGATGSLEITDDAPGATMDGGKGAYERFTYHESKREAGKRRKISLFNQKTGDEVEHELYEASEFSESNGTWVSVNKAGAIHLSANHYTLSVEEMKKITGFWVLDVQDQTPIYIRDRDSWAIPTNQAPRKVAHFNDLPEDMKAHLISEVAIAAEFDEAEDRVATLQKSESEKHKGELGVEPPLDPNLSTFADKLDRLVHDDIPNREGLIEATIEEVIKSVAVEETILIEATTAMAPQGKVLTLRNSTRFQPGEMIYLRADEPFHKALYTLTTIDEPFDGKPALCAPIFCLGVAREPENVAAVLLLRREKEFTLEEKVSLEDIADGLSRLFPDAPQLPKFGDGYNDAA